MLVWSLVLVSIMAISYFLASDFSKMRHNIGQKVGNCLDKRLLKELVEQGILTPEDISKVNNHINNFVHLTLSY